MKRHDVSHMVVLWEDENLDRWKITGYTQWQPPIGTGLEMLQLSQVIQEKVSAASVVDHSGLTGKENYLLECTVDIVNGFSKLPEEHPDDMDEMVRAIHVIQGLILQRPTRRSLKERDV